MASVRILSIVWYKVLPARFGGQKGIAHFNQALGKLFPLVCLCSRNNEPPADLSYKVLPELPVSKWQFFNPFVQQKIAQIAKKEKPTYIILEHPYHAKAAIKACKATGARLIVHSHNIESNRYRQLGKRGWRLLYDQEKRIHQQAVLSLFKTEEEMNYAVKEFKLLPDKCMVMPFGIELHGKPDKVAARRLIGSRHGIPDKCKLLLFAGTLDYAPNAEAVKYIYERIAPRLSTDIRIIICGRNKLEGFTYLNTLSHPLIINAGEAEDISGYFAAADLFINPVSLGGGVQTKNLDALSYDLNIVCLDTMVSGIDLSKCGGKIFTCHPGDLQGFCELIEKALAAPPSSTPSAFFDFYLFDKQVIKLAERL